MVLTISDRRHVQHVMLHSKLSGGRFPNITKILQVSSCARHTTREPPMLHQHSQKLSAELSPTASKQRAHNVLGSKRSAYIIAHDGGEAVVEKACTNPSSSQVINDEPQDAAALSHQYDADGVDEAHHKQVTAGDRLLCVKCG